MPKRTSTIRQTVFIQAKPEEVYEAIIDPGKHTAFTRSKATCQRRVGGKFTAWDGYISGRNLVLEDGERIVQEWSTTEWPEGSPPSILEFSFREKGKGTELKMVHSKVPSEQAQSYSKGWVTSYWEPLKEYFER